MGRLNGVGDWEKDPAALTVELLRGFWFCRNNQPVMLTPGSERLVAFLAINSHSSRRDHVASTLWLDESEHRAIASLRSAIWRLRLVAPEALEVNVSHVRLADCVRVDLHEAQRLAHRLMDGGEDTPEVGAEQILEGDVLPDWYDEWIVLAREIHRQLRLHALEALCVRLTKLGMHGRAVQSGLLAVGAEPLRETAHAVLIRAHLAEGNRSQALRQFDNYRRVLRDELALDPSPEIRGLVRFSEIDVPSETAP